MLAHDGAGGVARTEAVGGLSKLTEEILAVLDGVGTLLHGEIVAVDFGTVVDVGIDAMPAGFGVVPEVIQKARLAGGRG